MKQLLEKKKRTKIIVVTSLMLIFAWLVSLNSEEVNAANDQLKGKSESEDLWHSKKEQTPFYKQCVGKTYFFKDSEGHFLSIRFGKASKGKIKLYLRKGAYDSSSVQKTKAILGTVKSEKVKFKASKWHSTNEKGSQRCDTQKICGTIVIKNGETIKVKITSGKPGANDGSFLRKGKTVRLKHKGIVNDDFMDRLKRTQMDIVSELAKNLTFQK